jgi:hypothetical protein
MSVGYVALDHRERVAARSGMDARMTMFGLLESARRFRDDHGRFPDGLSELLAGRKPVRHSAQVAFVGPIGDGFCVVVGIDERREEPGEPIWTGITRVNEAGGASSPRRVRSCDVLR